ncbi:MAG: alpha-galactosidase [Clostridia bacterium]|nr:alpha-galactosidase [Clostridia bacterium]
MLFEVSEDGQLYLLNFSDKELFGEITEKQKKYFSPCEIHITGKNQDDHHGAKHTVTSGSRSLKYISHSTKTNKFGLKLEILLSDNEIEAILHYQLFDGISAVRCWTTVKNISDKAVGLEYVSSFSFVGIDRGEGRANDKLDIYVPSNSWVREVVWNKYTLSELGFEKNTPFSTKRINISNTGTWSSKEYLPMGCTVNRSTSTALMWQIENNGSWQWEISDIADTLYLKLSGPDERENHWYKSLEPNESFESVKAAVAIGTDFDTALSELTLYRRKIVRKNKADAGLPVIFNDYMNCLWADPTTEKMLPVIDIAKELGAEYYCMDAGWYADGTWWETVGEWQPCEWRFKNGICEVFDYIRSKGMIAGIWLEIEVMGINCPILSDFDEDCFFVRHGERVIDHGRYQLDFRNPKVREYATSVIDRLVGDYGIGYIKMDYNIDGGIGTEIDSDSFGDGLLGHCRAYRDWVEMIMNKYPELIIESCSSGGMRMDYSMLSLHPIQSISDQEDYLNNGHIAAAAATAVLPEQAAIWSYPLSENDENAVALNMINSMLLRMHLSGDVTNLSPDKLDIMKEGVRCYKNIRTDIPSFIPFYPLGIPQYSDKWQAAGYQNDEKIYFAIWRYDDECAELTIPVTAASAEIIYPSKCSATAVLCNNTLKVSIGEKNSAIIVKLNK